MGCDVYNLGMCPTPTVCAYSFTIVLTVQTIIILVFQVQYMVIKLETDAGLIITSSHNPTEWNGLVSFIVLISHVINNLQFSIPCHPRLKIC